MDKMKMSTPDFTRINVEKIAEVFPNVVTEAKDEQGNLVHKIDFEKLKQELSPDVIDGDENYDFTWVGKKSAMVEANKPTNKTLRPCLEDSVNWDKTENLYIEGDNLEVLKLLQESYLNKIKMIYIDPPYNTGNDFIYNDNFVDDDFEDNSGIIDKAGNRTLNKRSEWFRNTESNGKFHSDWCSMLYPRLKLARNLLSEDGIIFISIDDGEISNLRKICDEIFGDNNFVCSFIWEKTQHFGRQKANYYSNDDYIVCYARDITNSVTNNVKELLVEKIKTELTDAPLFNASNNVKILTFPAGSTKFNIKDGTYNKTKSDDYELITPVVVANGKNKNSFQLKFRSRWANDTVQEEVEKGTTFWVKTETFAIRAIYGDGKVANESPRAIIFTNQSNPMKTIGRLTSRIDTSENATSQLKEMFGDKAVFSYPKPVSLIEYFISLMFDCKTNKYNDNFYILDFFSGSGTTAEATLSINAKDDGKRKFILVQLNENLDENLQKAQNQQEKELTQNAIDLCDELKKSHYLTEIGKERIRRAGKKIIEETGKTDLDIGFRVLKLDESNMKDVYYTPDELSQSDLIDSISNIKDGRSGYDLLYQCMLEWGLELSLPHRMERINNNEVHIVNNGDLIACFDDKIPEETVKQIADLKPLRVVFRDSSFATPAARINVDEIFKLKSPQTTIKVL